MTVIEDTHADLVNRLTQEVAGMRRDLAAASRKLDSATRSLEARTQELAEARGALSLLLATLDATSEGILAVGHFGRATHFNARLISIWRIPQELQDCLTEPALLTLQLAQVQDPASFLARAELRKARPDAEHDDTVALADGRVLRWRTLPQRVRGKRVGSVTCYAEVTTS